MNKRQPDSMRPGRPGAAPGEAPTTTRPHPVRAYLAVAGAALGLYLLSLAPGPLWQDSGLAQTRVLLRDLVGTLGLALSHPLYYIVALAFQGLPFAESAYKTNLVSPVFGALTVANTYLLLRTLTGRPFPSLIGTLTLTVAHTFWQHCAIAETYTLSIFLLSSELLLLIRCATRPTYPALAAVFLINGLALANHVAALLDLPVLGAFLLWCLRRRLRLIPAVISAGGAWLLGASPFLALIVWQIVGGTPPADVICSALFGKWYVAQALNATISLRLVRNSLLYLMLNFPTPSAVLGLVGLASLRRVAPRPVGAVLGGLLAIHLLWEVRYDVPDQYEFFVPSIFLLSLMVGLGCARCFASPATWKKVVLVGLAVLPAGVYAVLPGVARRLHLDLGVKRDPPYRDRYEYFLRPWKTGYDGPRRFARQAHDVLPDGAVLVSDTTAVCPIHYMMLTGTWRKNVRVWPPPDYSMTLDDLTPDMIRDELARGLVYVVTPAPGYTLDWLLQRYRFEPAGVLYRVVPPAGAGDDDTTPTAASRPATAGAPDAPPPPPP